jgi:hypothetical protein
MHFGFIMPLYSNSMDYLIKAHVPAVEADFIKKPEPTTGWEQAYHSPELGIAAFYAWLGNPAELGNMIGVYPFINFHINHSYTEALYFRFGTGVGYMPVIFNRVDNYKNNVIGAHFNAMVNMRLTTHINLSQRMRIEAGLGITHCSDGNFTTPNLGINLITFNTGLSYCINPHKAVPEKPADTTLKRAQNDLLLAFGLSEIEPPGGKHYGDATLTYIRYYPVSSKSKLGLGADLFYDGGNLAVLKEDTVHLSSNLQNMQIGIEGSYEVTINKLALPITIGEYVYTKTPSFINMYNRFGLRYYANKNLILNLTLLTHFASAVYIEWGAGYRF